MSYDSELQQAVVEELSFDPRVAAAHIGVKVEGGVVKLDGHTATYAQKRAAETAAHRVQGVKDVSDGIMVMLTSESRQADEALATEARQSLALDASLPAGSVTAKVKDGVVTLSGVVEWHFQKEAAEGDIRRLNGVVGVIDEIRIESNVDAVNLQEDIVRALSRASYMDAPKIKVSARGSRVRLTGTARSAHQRQMAASLAWTAPGVTDVKNDILVV
jgi:osmotically-inducible protein OsmY